jgi:hypothetical protein
MQWGIKLADLDCTPTNEQRDNNPLAKAVPFNLRQPRFCASWQHSYFASANEYGSVLTARRSSPAEMNRSNIGLSIMSQVTN